MGARELLVGAYKSFVKLVGQRFPECAGKEWDKTVLTVANKSLPVRVHHVLPCARTAELPLVQPGLHAAVAVLHPSYAYADRLAAPAFTLHEGVAHLQPWEKVCVTYMGRTTLIQRVDEVPVHVVMGLPFLDIPGLYGHSKLVISDYADPSRLARYLDMLRDADAVLRAEMGKKAREIPTLDVLAQRLSQFI